MKKSYSRRQMLRTLSAASAGLLVSQNVSAAGFGAKGIEIQVSSVSAHTVRLSVLAIDHGKVGTIPNDGSLTRSLWGGPATKIRNASQSVRAGDLLVSVSRDPLVFAVSTSKGEMIQRILVDEQEGTVSFTTGNTPCSDWEKAALNSTAGVRSTPCVADKAAIAWRPMADECRFLGSSVPQDGRFSFISRTAVSISPAPKANSGPSAIPCHSIFSWLPLGTRKSLWLSMRGSPDSRKSLPYGASDISNRTVPWPAGKKF